MALIQDIGNYLAQLIKGTQLLAKYPDLVSDMRKFAEAERARRAW